MLDNLKNVQNLSWVKQKNSIQINLSAKFIKLLAFGRRKIDSSWRNIEFLNQLLKLFWPGVFFKMSKIKTGLNQGQHEEIKFVKIWTILKNDATLDTGKF